MKILLLTPIYPAENEKKSVSPVVHYFVREWVKTGHDVQVVHFSVTFPKIVYMIARPIKQLLSLLAGTEIRTWPLPECDYVWEGVRVKQIPVKKNRPHGRYSAKEICRATQKVINYCDEQTFKPDVIISHWVNPQYEVMHQLKQHYQVPTCFVAHDGGRDLMTIYQKEAKQYIGETNLLGYRSAPIKREFEQNFNCADNPNFQCYSGVPEVYIRHEERKISNVNSFIFVGTLIQRKFPAAIIPAIKEGMGNNDYTITYIGEGFEKGHIEQTAQKCGVEDKVKLRGFLKREEVIRQMDNHDVFVMISRNETFGLVYLEAMARGCITIASRNEGFDGVIEHGVNGFLCKAGDSKELANIIRQLRAMPSVELQRISHNAMQTAASLTDKKAAERYMEAVKNIVKEQ